MSQQKSLNYIQLIFHLLGSGDGDGEGGGGVRRRDDEKGEEDVTWFTGPSPSPSPAVELGGGAATGRRSGRDGGGGVAPWSGERRDEGFEIGRAHV